MTPTFQAIHIPPVPQNKKIFFASDFHLGTPNYLSTRERERKIVNWLDTIQPQAHALFLLGDIFDFWFEYKYVIPKGFARLQGKLASFTDSSIPIYLVPGNHDLWIQDYFYKELNIQMFYEPISVEVHNKKLLLGHGDELGGSKLYDLVKRYIYKSSILNCIFRNLPPNLSFSIAASISNLKKKKTYPLYTSLPIQDFNFKFCKEMIEPSNHHDYYVFGHLHLPYHKDINNSSTYFNIGDWITHFSYGMFDGANFRLAKFE